MSEPVVLTVEDFRAASGLGKTTVYKLMKTGQLARVKIGARTLITVESAMALLKAPPPLCTSLPTSRSRTMANRREPA
jgi:hypothetical protein